MTYRSSELSFILIVLVILLAQRNHAAGPDESTDWVLVWSDEFTGPAGQSPAANKWGYDIGTDWGNAQLEYDTDRPVNVSLDGTGHLAITAREESYMGQLYTSARIVTRNLYQPTYGRIEARIKLPAGQGIWPAFWLLGSDITTVGWPQCGEIDVMEFRGQEPNTVFGSLHGPGYAAGDAITQAYVLTDDRFDTAFHVFAVEWEENLIKWYVDDIVYHTARPEDLDGDEWVFDHPFYIILNVAVGGTFVGSPDASTIFPCTMLIDYVRVYQDDSNIGFCCTLRGDVNSSGTISVADLTTFIEFLFRGGAEPYCAEHADVNGSSSVSVADLTYYISYLFRDGPAPLACPPPATVPSSPAPTPTPDPADVISLFSDAYTEVPVNTWSATWDMADVEDYTIGAENMKKYTNLVFAGIEFTSPTVDASTMTHFHMDVWTPDATAAPAVFKIKLVDFGADGAYGGGDDREHEIALNESVMNTGSWVSIELALADFTSLTSRSHLAQLLISGDLSTVFVDNVYFHQ